MALAKAFFLLPLRDNDGRDLSNEIAEVRAQLYERFASFTSGLLPGLLTGTWKELTKCRMAPRSWTTVPSIWFS